jgi:hypothetical protein
MLITLCSMGWQDFLCKIWIIVVSFLYMFYSSDKCFLLIVILIKYMHFLCSFSKVNCKIL